MDLVQENVIVTATNFNVTLMTQVWLLDNEIVLRDEFTGAMLFTPGIVQVDAAPFRFLAIPSQVQFEPKCDEDREQRVLSDRLGRFVQLLPHTPYSAIGLNFTWHYRPPDNRKITDVSRHAFFHADSPFARLFDTPDARFGAYYSKDELGFRVKLTVGPVDVPHPDQPKEEVLQFAFNYHREAHGVADIVDALGRWTEAKQHSVTLVREFEAAL